MESRQWGIVIAKEFDFSVQLQVLRVCAMAVGNKSLNVGLVARMNINR